MKGTEIKLGYAPTRRSIFSAPDAIKYRGLTKDRLLELGVSFVDIDGPYTKGTYLWVEVENWKRLEARLVEGPYIHHCVGIHKDVVPVLYEACKYLGITPDLYDNNEEQVKAYCRDYISGYSPQEIAERYGVTEETILQLFYYISGRRVVSSRPKYYNALAKWMRSHGYSQRTFAAELGIPISRLKDVFAGYRHMDAELGQRISDMTGIPLKELYADVLPPKS